MKDPDRTQSLCDESSGDLAGRRFGSFGRKRPFRAAAFDAAVLALPAEALSAGCLLACCLSACCLTACSAATDVVAVDNSDPAAAPAAATPDVGALVERDNGALGRLVVPPLPAQEAPGSTTLIVAGVPVPDWQGQAFDWPLTTPLHAFFADPSAQAGDGNPQTGEPAGTPNSPNPSERASAFVSNGAYSPASDAPASDNGRHVADPHSKSADAERDAFQHLSTTEVGPWHDIHLVASTGSAADRLRSLFFAVHAMDHKDPSLVARDAFNDRYLVILEADSCGMPSAQNPAVAPDEACSKGARPDDE
jgi:hypothetical protein